MGAGEPLASAVHKRKRTTRRVKLPSTQATVREPVTSVDWDGTWAVWFRLGVRLAPVARRIVIQLLKTPDAAC